MEEYIIISSLNDFIFCPYSIYLHNVYMGADEDVYHAKPQTRGLAAHRAVDAKLCTNKDRIMALPVYCEELALMGKIDVLNVRKRLLVERKYQLKQIYQGQVYQLWAQYFCLIEMGYEVDQIAFYEISTNKMYYQALPTDQDKQHLTSFVQRYRAFSPLDEMTVNENKCRCCIYSNLCDKTNVNHDY